MDELKVGDRIVDNDPRMTYRRVLTVTEVHGDSVVAKSSSGRSVKLQRQRIFLDANARRTGFSRVTE